MPAELRIAIYEYLLVADEEVQIVIYKRRPTLEVACASQPAAAVYKSTRRTGNDSRLAITRVSKQVAHEVLPILYGKNKFGFSNGSTLVHILGYDRRQHQIPTPHRHARGSPLGSRYIYAAIGQPGSCDESDHAQNQQ